MLTLLCKFPALLTAVSIVLLFSSAPSSATPDPSPLPPLPDFVKQDLAKRDPSTYQTFDWGNGMTARDVQEMLEDHALWKRSQKDGLQTRCTKSSCINLTFDDGAYDYHKQLDAYLASQNILTSYFVNGANYRCVYDTAIVSALRASLAAGHQIASHSWSHPDLDTLTSAQLDLQVTLLETALYKTLGVVPAFIRPPFGSCGDACVKQLNDKHGLVVVNWNYDTGDTTSMTVSQQIDVFRSILPPKHATILAHEVKQPTVQTVIPEGVKILKKNGYKSANFYTVAGGLGLKPYKLTGTRGKRDSTWTCEGKPAPGQAA